MWKLLWKRYLPYHFHSKKIYTYCVFLILNFQNFWLPLCLLLCMYTKLKLLLSLRWKLKVGVKYIQGHVNASRNKKNILMAWFSKISSKYQKHFFTFASSFLYPPLDMWMRMRNYSNTQFVSCHLKKTC